MLKKCTFTKNEFSRARIGVQTSIKSLSTHDNSLQLFLSLFKIYLYFLTLNLEGGNANFCLFWSFLALKIRPKIHRCVKNNERDH